MRPLNFAILKYFATGKEACRADVQEALKGEYSGFKAFKIGRASCRERV